MPNTIWGCASGTKQHVFPSEQAQTFFKSDLNHILHGATPLLPGPLRPRLPGNCFTLLEKEFGMMRSLLVMMTLLLSLVGTQSAHAQAKGYVGLLVGLSVPDADDTSARPMYGVMGGARLDGEFGLGAFFLTASKEETIDGTKADFNYSLYGLEGSFHFEGVADGAFVAARVGLAKVKQGFPAGSENFSPLVWGIGFGYDYFLSEKFSLGAEAGFMSVQGESKTPNDLDGFTMLNFLVAAKMWF
jgi:hypothetical protein